MTMRNEAFFRIDHVNHAADHVLSRMKICNYTVFKGTYGLDVFVRFAMHLLCLFANGQNFIGGAVDGHNRGLIYHYFIIKNDQRIGRSQVNRNLLGEKIE
jgi:hypothetical protein